MGTGCKRRDGLVVLPCVEKEHIGGRMVMDLYKRRHTHNTM